MEPRPGRALAMATKLERTLGSGLGIVVWALALPLVYAALYGAVRRAGGLERSVSSVLPARSHPGPGNDSWVFQVHVASARHDFTGDALEVLFWPLARAEESIGPRLAERRSYRAFARRLVERDAWKSLPPPSSVTHAPRY